LVSKGANANVAAPSGFTPLHVAAGLDRRGMVEYLLSAGANPNALDIRGTPLHAATVQGNAEMVKLLLAHGADPNARDRNGSTPLHMINYLASYYASHTEIVLRLAEAGGDLFALEGKPPHARTAAWGVLRRSEAVALAIIGSRARLTPSNPQAEPLPVTLGRLGYVKALELAAERDVPLAAAGMDGTTGMHGAASAGKTDALRFFLGKGLAVDARDAAGRTPLHAAAGNDQVGAVAILLEAGAHLEARDSRGWTPLMHAVSSWREGGAARALLARKADLGARDAESRSVLEIAFMGYDRDDRVQQLLEHDAPAAAADAEGRTALHKVLTPKQAAMLIGRGLDVNAADKHGLSPLFYAVKHPSRSEELSNALLAHGAGTDRVAADGSRLVHHAATRNSKVLESLLAGGKAGRADEAMPDGRTPLHWAAEHGHPGTIAVLLKHGADIDAQTAGGDTPLHFAARAPRATSNVNALLKAGANPALRNRRGETPVEAAERAGNAAALKVLQSASPK
jgi:ankyrin repeat protein